jgi:hypothetical protein
MSHFEMADNLWHEIRIYFGYNKADRTKTEVREIDSKIEEYYGLRCVNTGETCFRYRIVDEKKYTLFLLRWS